MIFAALVASKASSICCAFALKIDIHYAYLVHDIVEIEVFSAISLPSRKIQKKSDEYDRIRKKYRELTERHQNSCQKTKNLLISVI